MRVKKNNVFIFFYLFWNAKADSAILREAQVSVMQEPCRYPRNVRFRGTNVRSGGSALGRKRKLTADVRAGPFGLAQPSRIRTACGQKISLKLAPRHHS